MSNFSLTGVGYEEPQPLVNEGDSLWRRIKIGSRILDEIVVKLTAHEE